MLQAQRTSTAQRANLSILQLDIRYKIHCKGIFKQPSLIIFMGIYALDLKHFIMS